MKIKLVVTATENQHNKDEIYLLSGRYFLLKDAEPWYRTQKSDFILKKDSTVLELNQGYSFKKDDKGFDLFEVGELQHKVESKGWKWNEWTGNIHFQYDIPDYISRQRNILKTGCYRFPLVDGIDKFETEEIEMFLKEINWLRKQPAINIENS